MGSADGFPAKGDPSQGDQIRERLRHVLDGLSRRDPPRVGQFSCSFCDAARQDVAKLISGPRVSVGLKRVVAPRHAAAW